MTRKPIVSGQFYPQTGSSLDKMLSKLIDLDARKEDALGVVLPHAGYVYSGSVAGFTLSNVDVKKTAVILGTNHTCQGAKFGIMTKEPWETPMGIVKIDTEIAEAILKESTLLKEDVLAHLNEHSIEVELPFLQYIRKDIKIVPITVSNSSIDELMLLGKEIADGFKKVGRAAMFIASTDFTHYETKEAAEKNDKLAINSILELDEEKLYNTIKDNSISMCGVAPVCVLINLCKHLGAKKSQLIKYQTSGDITGDASSVVGYAGIILC